MAALFFAFYEARLIRVWPAAASPRPAGMFIGLIVFPLAVIGFGTVAISAAKRGLRATGS
jgi:hypothetical protein